jgi:hypothetical protein
MARRHIRRGGGPSAGRGHGCGYDQGHPVTPSGFESERWRAAAGADRQAGPLTLLSERSGIEARIES